MTNPETEDTRKSLKDRGICVLVPTYDNAGTIVDVVRRSLEQCDDVIVVCDGCTDGSVSLLENMALPPSAHGRPDIVVLPENRGKGAALRAGFRHALARGFSYAITLDGDGQHFPEDIPLMLQANRDNPGALIVGARRGLDKADRSGASKFANSFSNFWFALQTGHRLRDTQTGYRLYPLKKLGGLSLLTSRYEAELELMVFASWRGVPLVNREVDVYYPPRDERVSHFRPALDFGRISLLNAVLCFLAVVYGYPRCILRGMATFFRSLYSLLFAVVNMMLIMTPLAHLYLAFGKVTEEKRYNLHRMLNFMAKFLLYRHGIPGAKFSEANPCGEDFSRPAVIICNHQSHLDIVPLLARTPKMVVITAGWVWKNPLYRYVIHNAEFIPATEGMAAMMPKLRSLVARGYSIAIFPEGTRSPDCRIGRFHQGAFHIAEQLGLDIVPVILYGAGKVLPKYGKAMHRWPMRIEIDRRISPEELSGMGDTTRARASAMRRYYIRRYTEMADLIEQDV